MPKFFTSSFVSLNYAIEKNAKFPENKSPSHWLLSTKAPSWIIDHIYQLKRHTDPSWTTRRQTRLYPTGSSQTQPGQITIVEELLNDKQEIHQIHQTTP